MFMLEWLDPISKTWRIQLQLTDNTIAEALETSKAIVREFSKNRQGIMFLSWRVAQYDCVASVNIQLE